MAGSSTARSSILLNDSPNMLLVGYSSRGCNSHRMSAARKRIYGKEQSTVSMWMPLYEPSAAHTHLDSFEGR